MFVQTLFLLACFASGVISSGMDEPCRVSDQHCIDVSIRAALPNILSANASLGVESSDPLFVESIVGNLPIVKYVFYDSTVLGYKNCEISDIRLATDLTNLHFVLNCNKVSLSGKYEISGHLVVLPVEGKGDYNLISGEYKLTVDAQLKKYVGSDGKNHLAIENFKLKSEALSALHFDFKNLFNGRKHLSDAIHKYAHENWQLVAKLFQDSTWYGTLKKVLSNINKYLQSVVLEDMLIEEDFYYIQI